MTDARRYELRRQYLGAHYADTRALIEGFNPAASRSLSRSTAAATARTAPAKRTPIPSSIENVELARHEAAHAVAGLALGLRVLEVVVNPNTHMGYTTFPNGAIESLAPVDQAALAAAGPIAEHCWRNPPSNFQWGRTGWLNDENDISKLALGALDLDRAQRTAFYHITMNAEAVEALVAALLDRGGRLDEAEIRAITEHN